MIGPQTSAIPMLMPAMAPRDNLPDGLLSLIPTGVCFNDMSESGASVTLSKDRVALGRNLGCSETIK